VTREAVSVCWVGGAMAGARKAQTIGKGRWSRVPILFICVVIGIGLNGDTWA
jgi:hypothetical protein